MNGLVIVVGLIILTGVFVGLARGAVKILVSLIATILTAAVVFFITPYISDGICALTPLDEMVEEQIRETLFQIGEEEASEQKDAVQQGAVEEDSSEESVGLAVWKEKLQLGTTEEIPRNTQIALIKDAEFPEVFKDLLLSNNNNEVYDLLGVHTFVDYVVEYLTNLFINILSFVLTFVVVTIVVRVVLFMLDFMADLPMLGFLNRLAGMAIGTSMSLIVVWVLFTLIMLLYSTAFGKILMQMIEENPFLQVLYNVNPILKMVTILR